MKVINKTSYPIIAFGYHVEQGYAEDVTIQPGESADVSGPYVGEMGGGDCYIHLEGAITCHEGPDDDHGFQVVRGTQLCLSADGRGVTVRHHLDEPEPCVVQWRHAQPLRKK
ncbi:MAG: hypothetical protein IPJ68_05135 [Candidatus Moraniibacteriota bacterium]|nr:MAG: hypothetical protein IPJ68_05135 [Candidatus Moranbacteria bacterium]